MGELIRRQFKSPGDPEKARDFIWTISSSYLFPPFLSGLPTLSGSRTSLPIICNLTNSTTCTNLRWWSEERLARVTSQLETCWKYLQTTLSRGKINLSRDRAPTLHPCSIFIISFLLSVLAVKLDHHVSQVSTHSSEGIFHVFSVV